MKVYIIGMGMGGGTVTAKAREALSHCGTVIGAKRLTEYITDEKNIYNAYKPLEIKKLLDGCKTDTAVIMSGDTGFYSGAKALLKVLDGYDTEIISGISSFSYFCARLKTSYDDAAFISLHGKNANIIQYIRQNKKVFALLDGAERIKSITQKLRMYGMDDVVLNIGERLGYADEKITSARAADITDFDFDALSVLLAVNPRPVDISRQSIPDEDFIRGGVPMTKSDVRTISIAKLGLKRDSVLYDIGSGTGSVSVEAALKLIDGHVYAIEKNEDAVKLTESNKIKFCADNIDIIKAEAPFINEDIEPPTNVFIGGSGGSLQDIIKFVMHKNPSAIIVINAVTLDTVAQAEKLTAEFGFESDVTCITAAKGVKAGSHRLMRGQNPVYIYKLWKAYGKTTK